MEGEKYVLRLNCEYLDYLNLALGSYATSEKTQLQSSMASMEVVYRSESEEWTQTMVVAGISCAVVPQYMSLNAELQMQPLIEPEVLRTIGVATFRGRPHTPMSSLFQQPVPENELGI